jgi:predicted transglutaminase-like cysteine proteinase
MRWTILISAAATLFSASAAMAEADPLSPSDIGSVVVTGRSITPSTPDIFGTVALDAGVTPYGARWRRVSAADASDPRIRALGGMVSRSSLDPVDRLAVVQREVAHRVHWRGDLDTYRVSDYWAQAGETLTRGAGDGEDIAVLKMQILKAAGFPARDIYLSIGRDRDRGADTLLLVHVGSEFYSLDDRETRPLHARTRRQFTPIFTLGKDSAWVHGSRVATRSLPRSARVSLARPMSR